MSETKTVMAWPDNEWPDWPTADGQPTTGAKSYGGIVGQIPPPDTDPNIGPPEIEKQPGIDEPRDDDEQPDTGEPRMDFPADDTDAPPEVKLQP